MKTIYLMRHAKSDWADKKVEDWDRPLSKHGRKAMPAMGKFFEENKIQPQLILASPASRARQTCELLVDEIHYRGDIHFVSSLYQAEQDTCLKEIKQLPESVDSVLVIGHNPGLETLFQMFSGQIESLQTKSIACIQVNVDSWKDLDYDCPAGPVQLLKLKSD